MLAALYPSDRQGEPGSARRHAGLPVRTPGPVHGLLRRAPFKHARGLILAGRKSEPATTWPWQSRKLSPLRSKASGKFWATLNRVSASTGLCPPDGPENIRLQAEPRGFPKAWTPLTYFGATPRNCRRTSYARPTSGLPKYGLQSMHARSMPLVEIRLCTLGRCRS